MSLNSSTFLSIHDRKSIVRVSLVLCLGFVWLVWTVAALINTMFLMLIFFICRWIMINYLQLFCIKHSSLSDENKTRQWQVRNHTVKITTVCFCFWRIIHRVWMHNRFYHLFDFPSWYSVHYWPQLCNRMEIYSKDKGMPHGHKPKNILFLSDTRWQLSRDNQRWKRGVLRSTSSSCFPWAHVPYEFPQHISAVVLYNCHYFFF